MPERTGPAGRPPSPPRRPQHRLLHGVTDVDDYAWMASHDDEEFLSYLGAERAYYEAAMAPLGDLVGGLAAESSSRLPATAEDSVRYEMGDFTYWWRTPGGREHSQFFRCRTGGEREELLVDEEALARPSGFVHIGVLEPSPDGSLLAYSTDTTGTEFYELHLKDLGGSEDLAEVIFPTYPGSAWSADSRHLFYVVPDALNRPYQVWRHAVGCDPSEDELVFEEDDRRFDLTLELSRSGDLVVITSASRDTSEVRLLASGRPREDPVVVAARREGVEYRIDHGRDDAVAGGSPAGLAVGELYMVTNEGASEFRLLRAPLSDGRAGDFEPVDCPAFHPAREDTRLVRCDVFAGRLLFTLRRSGSSLLAVSGRDGGGLVELAPSLEAGTIRLEHAECYDRGSVIVAEESLVEPLVFSELRLSDGMRSEVLRKSVPGYESGRFRTSRLSAPLADGTSVPVTLAARHDVDLDGSAPLLLYGYGAYESCLEPEFDVSLPSLLERGVIYAVAHVRGGGECGRSWWEQGRLRNKKNTFDDFVGVAEWLAGDAPGSTPRVDGSRIVSRGLSAGGLLQGAVFSRAPRRFRAVVAEVPFVDCVTTMLDPDIPLTVNEWDEWGDPRQEEDYLYIRSYSPYDNPPAGRRPDLLVTGAVNDRRVLVHEPAKWVARLRQTDTEGSRLIFRAELGAAAHTGPSGRFARLSYEAEVQAFVLDAMSLA